MGGTTSCITIYQFAISGDAAPNDYLTEWQILRVTAFGSAGSALTPVALKPSDPAVQTAYAGLLTFTSNGGGLTSNLLWDMGVHMRAPFVFTCVPAHEFEAPATSANGFYFLTPTVPTAFATILNTWHYE